ncbi:MAG: hypothetical protein HRT35_34645 [Algicola sp.]|nr:hypothetical protein [Algicola sp.]
MSSVLRGPNILKGAFVSVDSQGVTKTLSFQFNPANLKRSLKPQMVGGEQGDRSMAVRFKGAPVQTIDADIEFDASSGLDNSMPNSIENGVYSQLAALEIMLAPSCAVVNKINSQLNAGVMEVAPMLAPTIYFVWGKNRVLPVKISQYTITEEQFDADLNPIQVSVSASMTVLSYSDLDSSNHAYQQYMVYQQTMESIAAKAYGSLQSSGVNQSQIT